MTEKRERKQAKGDATYTGGWGTSSEIQHLEGVLSGKWKMDKIPPEDPEWVLKRYLHNGNVREQQGTWGSVEWSFVRTVTEQTLQGLRQAEAGFEG